MKVELVENRTQAEPIALHHIHFDANDVDAMKAWYFDLFGAAPGDARLVPGGRPAGAST